MKNLIICLLLIFAATESKAQTLTTVPQRTVYHLATALIKGQKTEIFEEENTVTFTNKVAYVTYPDKSSHTFYRISQVKIDRTNEGFDYRAAVYEDKRGVQLYIFQYVDLSQVRFIWDEQNYLILYNEDKI